jgi:glyoxylase I family protein
MFKGLEHIGMMTKDTTNLAAWYQEILQFKLICQNLSQPPTYLLAGSDNAFIEIYPMGEHSIATGFENMPFHFAIEVIDLDTAVEYLKSKGVEFVTSPNEAFGGGRIINFKDPEGRILQLVQRPKGFK